MYEMAWFIDKGRVLMRPRCSVGSYWHVCFQNVDFLSIFDRIVSAVTLKRKKLNYGNTNRKSTTRFLMSLRWSSYVALSQPREAHQIGTYWAVKFISLLVEHCAGLTMKQTLW